MIALALAHIAVVQQFNARQNYRQSIPDVRAR
jgi:hypothetical protein